MNINKNKVGIMFGVVAGGLHLIWSVFVALGWAQPWLNFVFKLHMIDTIPLVGTFHIATAIYLVIITTIIGYIVGNIFAMVWNYLHK